MTIFYNDLFLKILEILNYKDRENFVKELEQENHLEAVTNCVQILPLYEQQEIIAHPEDPAIVHKYISKDLYMEEMSKVSAKILREFLQHMTPVLTDTQKEQIAAVFPN